MPNKKNTILIGKEIDQLYKSLDKESFIATLIAKGYSYKAAYHRWYYRMPANKREIRKRSGKWYEDNLRQAKKTRAAWRARPENKAKMRGWMRRYRENHPEEYKRYNATSNANRRKKVEEL